MGADHLPDYRQSEPTSVLGSGVPVGTGERLPDALPIPRGNAGTSIFNRYDHVLGSGVQRQGYCLSFPAVADRVVEEVHHGMADCRRRHHCCDALGQI